MEHVVRTTGKRVSTERGWTVIVQIVLSLVFIASVESIAAENAGEASGYRIYRALDMIRFERHCADAEAHQVQAWAELRSVNGRARALVRAYARHDPVRRNDIFVGLRLVGLRIEAGEVAIHSNWTMRMEAHGAGGTYVDVEHSGYDSNPARGEGEHHPFRADETGALEWLDFSEPDDGKGGGRYPYNWSPEMETTAARLKLSDDSREVALDLVLTQLGTGKTIWLAGPTVWIPDRIWHGRPPKPKTLGPLSVLNPFQKGGVWQWLRRGAKYGDCIEERRTAKRTFFNGPN